MTVTQEHINNLLDTAEVKEIVVFAKDDKIRAEVFPDYEFAKSHGIEDIETEIERIVDKINVMSPSDEQINSFTIRNHPFERTSTGKLKRTEFYY